jgi:hypothetical protein
VFCCVFTWLSRDKIRNWTGQVACDLFLYAVDTSPKPTPTSQLVPKIDIYGRSGGDPISINR